MHGKLRDELLDREVFDTLWESEVFVERWRWEYNTVRLHSALGYRPPAPETVESVTGRVKTGHHGAGQLTVRLSVKIGSPGVICPDAPT